MVAKENNWRRYASIWRTKSELRPCVYKMRIKSLIRISARIAPRGVQWYRGIRIHIEISRKRERVYLLNCQVQIHEFSPMASEKYNTNLRTHSRIHTVFPITWLIVWQSHSTSSFGCIRIHTLYMARSPLSCNIGYTWHVAQYTYSKPSNDTFSGWNMYRNGLLNLLHRKNAVFPY